MANKIIFSGLIVALLQVASAEEANPEPYMNDAPLTIYVDAGKEIDQFLSLAKSIDGKLSVLGDALESITQKVSKLERRELRNQQTRRMLVEVKATAERMSAEVKATEERCTQKVSELERKLEDLINPQTKSSAVATRPKRRAELACEKTHGLRSAGIRNNTIPYIINFVDDYADSRNRDGVLIEKRFVLIIAMRWSFLHSNIKKLKFSFSNRIVSKRIKKVHTVGEYFLDSIILVELDSDVDYNNWLYPTCLYTSELNPKSGLINDGKTIQIVKDSKCYIPYSKKLSPSEICVYGGCSFTDNLVFLVEEETTPQLFGFVHCNDYFEYQTLYKVFPNLDFIENIVWPKNGN
ncbi:uncharacterized protein LOC105233799 [Bactrocera dorsalis]|uniref:Uncharacterized protein LOC105233799 n=1 Tax=Bactrocera dorsalis TaxID=27457 RepID=A0ABM3JEM4_BACDO|nr:uncharacterized protein LOC105233799 [Bactrocera dorsalis]